VQSVVSTPPRASAAFVQYGKHYLTAPESAANGGPEPVPGDRKNTAPPIHFRRWSSQRLRSGIIGFPSRRARSRRQLQSNTTCGNLVPAHLAARPPGNPARVTNTARCNSKKQRQWSGEAGDRASGAVEQKRRRHRPSTATRSSWLNRGYRLDFFKSLPSPPSAICCDPETVQVVAPTSTEFFHPSPVVVGEPEHNTGKRFRTVRVRLGVRSRESDRPLRIVPDPRRLAQSRAIPPVNIGGGTGQRRFRRLLRHLSSRRRGSTPWTSLW